MAYDDERYGVVERKVFGLPARAGGGGMADTPITFNESESTPVERWYPGGPINIIKAGLTVHTAIGKGEEIFTLKKDNSVTVVQLTASTSAAEWTVASTTTIASAHVGAASYLTLIASTNICSTGSVSVWIDYTRFFEETGNWETGVI